MPAGGAGRVRAEPFVNAADVEAVVALGQHPDPLPGGEVGEADGALGVQAGQLEVGRIAYDGESLEGLLFNPRVGQGSGGRCPHYVGRLGPHEGGAPESAADDGVEAEGADEGAEED